VARLAHEERERRRPGGEIEDTRAFPRVLGLAGELLLPAGVLVEREGPREGVVAGRDAAENRLGVARPLFRILRPTPQPAAQIANLREGLKDAFAEALARERDRIKSAAAR